MKMNNLLCPELANPLHYVFRKINRALKLNSKNNREITYFINLNAKIGRGGMSCRDEQVILEKLVSEGILEKSDEADIGEVGKQKTSGYQAFEIHHLRVNNEFETAYLELKNLGHKKGLLSISPNGETIFSSSSGKVYSFKFNPASNQFKLLWALALKSNKTFSTSEIDKVLNSPRDGAESSTSKRRLLDTVKAIRTSMKLPREEMIGCKSDVHLLCQVAH